MANVLRKLQQLHLVEFRDGKYRVVKDNMHLSVESPIYQAYRTLLRLKSVERIEKLPSDQSYNFSAIFSTSREVKEIIHRDFLNFLGEIQLKVKNDSGMAKEVYQLNFDLFSWSE